MVIGAVGHLGQRVVHRVGLARRSGHENVMTLLQIMAEKNVLAIKPKQKTAFIRNAT